MDDSMLYDLWLWWMVGGVVFLFLELVLPGLVIVFFGIGALLTGGLVYFGFLKYISSQLLFWAVSSFVLLAALREQLYKIFPPDQTRHVLDEAQEITGKVVEVLADIDPDSANGRVRFQGSSWAARSISGMVVAGERARVLRREDLVLFVEVQGDGETES